MLRLAQMVAYGIELEGRYPWDRFHSEVIASTFPLIDGHTFEKYRCRRLFFVYFLILGQFDAKVRIQMRNLGMDKG